MQNLFNVNTLIVHMLMYACVSIWNFVLFFWYLTYILVVDFFDNAENFVICTIVDYRFRAAILSFFFFLFVERISCWNLTLTIVLSKISKGFCPKILFLNLIISLDFIDLYQMVFLKGYMNLIIYCQLAATEKKEKEKEKRRGII